MYEKCFVLFNYVSNLFSLFTALLLSFGLNFCAVLLRQKLSEYSDEYYVVLCCLNYYLHNWQYLSDLLLYFQVLASDLSVYF